ncbi:hypothetical protein ASD76_08450 [Altererythrobacter sp. Root672]|nr:hypothetical protein ASD76_08450 [Altererythrobacter sp. Root672]
MDRVTVFHDVDDASWRPLWINDLHYCLVSRGIERRTPGLDPADPDTFEHRRQRTLDGPNAFDQGRRTCGRAGRIPGCVDRPTKIVDDCQQLAREVGDRVVSCLVSSAIGSPTHVFGIGQRPQQAVLQRCILRLQASDVRRFSRLI